MDPNAAFQRFLDAVGDFDAMWDAANDLAQWLRDGGFEPEWKRFPGWSLATFEVWYVAAARDIAKQKIEAARALRALGA